MSIFWEYIITEDVTVNHLLFFAAGAAIFSIMLMFVLYFESYKQDVDSLEEDDEEYEAVILANWTNPPPRRRLQRQRVNWRKEVSNDRPD